MCTSGSASSFVGGSVTWTANGGQNPNYSTGAGGASGSTVKNGVTTAGNLGGSSDYYNGGPALSAGGGGGGAAGAGYNGALENISVTANVIAGNGETVSNLSVSMMRHKNVPIGGSGIATTDMLPAASQRNLGCGGSGAFSIPSINYLFGSQGLPRNRSCTSAGYGEKADLLYTVGTPSWHYHLFGTRQNVIAGSNSLSLTAATGGLANSGSGGGGATNGSEYSSPGPAGLGGSGVVLIRYAAPVPVNNTAPTISPGSNPWVGTTITRTAGTWTDPLGGTLTITGKWQRVDSITLVATDIPGETGPTYVVTADDINYRLLYRETASNGTGSASFNSGSTAVVYGAPVFTTNSPPSTAPTGTAFSYTFVASGGGITYSKITGTLPTGLSLSSAGVLSGTPTVAGSYTFTVRATNAVNFAESTHTIHVGRSATLSTSSTPQASGVQFSISPTLTLATGATPGASVSVTASVVASPVGGTHTLGGTVIQTTDGSGIATWNDLLLTGTAGTYTVRFSASGWPNADLTVTLGAGSATALAITTQPLGGVLPGATLGTVPVVRVVDSAGNTVTSSTATILATIASGSVNATLTAASATASSGVATFTGMKVNQAGGNFTLSFASTGLTSVTSNQFTINRTAQSISFSYTGGAKTYTSADFRVSASTTSQLPVVFSSSTPTVCDVSGDAAAIAGVTGAVVSVVGVGTCTIHADQPGDDQFSAATRQSVNITVSQAAQSGLSLSNSTTVVFGNTLTLSTAGGSGTGGVTYSLVGGAAGSAVCTVNPTTGAMTFGAAGSCSVKAQKAADANYTVQNSADTVITVSRAAQTVDFTSSVPARPLPGGTYTVTASTSSGLAPTLAIVAGAGTVCSISGSSSPATVTFITSGDCVVKASQAGNGNYLAAAIDAEQAIDVGSLNQSITFASLVDRDFGDPSEAVSVSASSGLTVTLTNETPTVCSLTGRTVAIITIGRCTITASQAGNSVYAAAASVTRSFEIVAVVANPPTIASVSAQSGAVTIGFSAPTFSGGVSIIGYRMIATPTAGGTAIESDDCTATPCVFDGLTNGTEYTIELATRNSVGLGPVSAPSPAITPVTAALAPRGAHVVNGDRELTVSWTAPDDFGGGAFIRYEVRLREAGDPWPSSASHTSTNPASGSHTFTSLTNGVDYEVQIVTITSANGDSISGNTTVVLAVPMTTASAPQTLTASAVSPREAIISWSVPLDSGGAPITGYTVTIDDVSSSSNAFVSVLVNGPTCGTVTVDLANGTASCRVSDLDLDTTYTVTVTADNVMGPGASASTSHSTPSFTPPAGPGANPPPCVNCFDDPNDPNDAPVTGSPTTTPPSTNPGSITLGDGVATVTLTSAAGTPSNVDSSGRLVIRSNGSAVVSGTGILATTTASVWLVTAAWGSAVVGNDGTFTVTLPIPDGTTTGVKSVSVDVVNENGAQRRFAFEIYVIGSSPTTLPNNGWTGGPGVTGGPGETPSGTPNDPTRPCSGCVSVFPIDSAGGTPPVVTSAAPGTSPGQVTVTTGSGTTVTLGGASGPGGATTGMSSSGGFRVRPPGTIPVNMGGLLPGSTVTVWIGGLFSVQGTVGADGTITLAASVPASLASGLHDVRIDATEADGTARSFVFGIELVASNSTLPITGTDTREVLILGLWLCVVGILGSAIIRRRGSLFFATRS